MDFIEIKEQESIETIETNTNETIHSKDPFVSTIDNLITDDECSHMINISKDLMKSSLVSDGKKGIVSQGRTSSNAWIQHNHDEITKSIGEKIARLVGMPLENAEAYQVIHYDENAQYRQHFDSWDHNGSEKTLRCMKYGGARLKTALVYLNDVEEGGSTRLNKLNIDVLPKKGKLLIFENTYNGTNVKHPLSEHAGMPVIKGEKYAFNLWFKECHSKKLYSEFNPDYYTNIESKPNSIENIPPLPDTQIEQNILYKYTGLDKLEGFTKKTNKKGIYSQESYISQDESDKIISLCDFTKSNGKYSNCWINKKVIPELISRIADTIQIKPTFFENGNVYKYSSNQSHGPFMDAYNLSSENGKKYTEKLGQRIYTISIPLNNTLQFNVENLKENLYYNPMEIIISDNILKNSLNTRDDELNRTITNANTSESYILNIYVREKDINGNKLESHLVENVKSIDTVVSSTLTETSVEDYKDTFEQVLRKFENNEITTSWQGLNSFRYGFKGDFEYFNKCVQQFIAIRKTTNKEIESININTGEVIDVKTEAEAIETTLNPDNLNKTYSFDEYNPVIVENVLNNDTMIMLKEYYKTTIKNGVFVLGDKQSNRYKSHNEPMSRILHYEIQPLIEKILGKPVIPTYTYLSAYVEGADLPPHTDRAHCEYTVSFLINKPDNLTWPIYLHKIKQPIKHKGRSVVTPSKDECIAVDCNTGGLMMFQGIDHIHFREQLPGEYYHIVLLHYISA